MRRAAPAILLLGVPLLSCHEDPIGPADDLRPAFAIASSVSLPACTKHWTKQTGGDWSVAANWSPAGVPNPTATVCIDAIGSYTVTVTGPKTVNALIVGGTGTTATLSYGNGGVSATWSVTAGIHVKAGSTLDLGDPVTIVTGFLQVDGTARANFPTRSGSFDGDSLLVTGLLELNGATVSTEIASVFRNTGTVQVTGPAAWLTVVGAPGAELRMDAGTILGQGLVSLGPTIDVAQLVNPATFHWSGGTIPVRQSGTDARLRVTALPIALEGSAPAGAVDLYGIYIPAAPPLIPTAILPPLTVTSTIGRIPVGVQLTITGLGGLATLPAINAGTVSVAGPLTVEFKKGLNPRLENSGTLVINPGFGTVITSPLDSLVNTGTIALHATPTIGTLPLLRNAGTITVDSSQSLVLTGATFAAEAGSIQTGSLKMVGGQLSGTGTVGNINSVGAQIEPGKAGGGSLLSGVGTLSATSLVLDAGSSVGIELGGLLPGAHDELVVTGLLAYAGALRIREIPPFAGGSCGQVVPIISDGSPAGLRGSFGVTTGLNPAAGRGWRTYMPVGSLQLIGHDPALAVSRSAGSLSVAEGGAGSSYQVCLRAAPTASVTVSPSSVGGQLVAMPAANFSPAAWALPKSIPVSAVDDLVYEPPPQTATIAHSVTSPDPAYAGAPLSPVTVSITDNDGTTNLELGILSPPPVVTVGQTFVLTLRDYNAGPNVSVGATLTIPASAGFVYLSSSGVSCSYDAVTGTTCQLPGLAPSVGLDFTVTMTAVAAGAYPTTFTLTTVQTDPNLANNVRTQTITVN